MGPLPNYIATRMANVKPSATLALNQQAAELRARGADILALTAGEPDFATPSWVCEAAKRAMAQGQTRYTAVGGTPELKQAICEKMARDYHLDVRADQVVAGTGGKQIIFNALMATLNAGDEVIVPAPYWVSYPSMIEIMGGSMIPIATYEAQEFKITPEQLEAAITPRTKWLILNSPSNPTGSAYSAEELFALAQVLLRHPHVLVMSDDIYEKIVYDLPFSSLLMVEPKLAEQALIVNGVSKAYAMTGWRLGFGVGPLQLIKAMTSIQSQSTSNPCSITQAAALEALRGPQDFLEEWRSAYRKRRDYLVDTINSIEHVHMARPQGAFYGFVNVSQLLGARRGDHARLEHDTDVAAYFLEHAEVATVPGSAFGTPGYLRLSYAVSQETLAQALERLGVAIKALTVSAT